MNRKYILPAIVLILTLLCSCSNTSSSSAPFNGILDSDTGAIYKLGDSKDVFDSAFGQPSFNEKTNEYNYLSEILTVTFDDNNNAVCIESSGKSNRFIFYGFDFDKPLKEIEGRYEKDDKASGFVSYSKYFDKNGNSCSIDKAAYWAWLMVRDGDMELLDLKDGEYVSYSIRTLDSMF